MSPNQEKCNTFTEWAHWKVKVDAARDPVDDLIDRAQKIWVRRYGASRQSSNRPPRVYKGMVRGMQPGTEAAFRHARRSAGASANSTETMNMPIDQIINDIHVDGWGDAHEKEAEFARKKRGKRQIMAMRDGLLTDAEITPDIRERGLAEDRAAVERASGVK